MRRIAKVSYPATQMYLADIKYIVDLLSSNYEQVDILLDDCATKDVSETNAAADELRRRGRTYLREQI